MRTIIAWLVLATAALAQITVPAETPPYTPIVASVITTVPTGATIDGGWTVSDGVHTLPCGNDLHVWASPGVHSIEYKGFWLLLKDVTFVDGNGQEITITSYLGHGFVNEEAEFTVTGGVDPEPDPPLPPQDKKYQIVIFLVADEIEKLPDPQRELATSLKVREDLRDLGHEVVQVIDDDEIKEGVPVRWKPWIKAVLGRQLPQVALAPINGGPIKSYDLPDNYAGLLRLLEGGQ